MARSFVSASSQSLTRSGAVVAAAPFTVSLWAYPTSFAAEGIMFAVVNEDAGARHRFFTKFPSSGVARFVAVSGSVNTLATANTANVNAWNHVVCVASSTSDRAIRLNGDTKAAVSSANTPSGLEHTHIGSDSTEPFDGRVAEVGVWDVALDDNEQLALSKGICPLLIRPQSLVAYWPLYGNDSPELDRSKNAFNLTLSNAPTKADHPRIYYPTGNL